MMDSKSHSQKSWKSSSGKIKDYNLISRRNYNVKKNYNVKDGLSPKKKEEV